MQLLPSILAVLSYPPPSNCGVSLSAFEWLGGTGLVKAHLSFSRMGLSPCPPPVTRRKDQSGDGALGVIPSPVLLLRREQERWWLVLLGCSDTRQDRVTSLWESEAMAMLFSLLPAFFPCPPQMRLPFPELKAKTFRNFWMAEERCIETDELQFPQVVQFIS